MRSEAEGGGRGIKKKTEGGREGGGHAAAVPGIFVLKHESRKIAYFWVVQKFKVLVFRSGRFGLLPAAA